MKYSPLYIGKRMTTKQTTKQTKQYQLSLTNSTNSTQPSQNKLNIYTHFSSTKLLHKLTDLTTLLSSFTSHSLTELTTDIYTDLTSILTEMTLFYNNIICLLWYCDRGVGGRVKVVLALSHHDNIFSENPF